MDLPNTRLRRDDPRPMASSPSDRRPDRVKRALVLGVVKVWPGQGEACGKVSATANLDDPCARRRGQRARRDEETGVTSNKETDEGTNDALGWRNPFTKNTPYKACSAFTRVTACTLALSPYIVTRYPKASATSLPP